MTGWPSLPFAEVFAESSAGGRGIPRSRYLATGALPIVDQGRAVPAGYTDDLDRAHPGPLPVLVFGDHTRRVTYVDFPFAVGADGVKVLRPRPGFDPRYLYHALRAVDLPSAGYSRHFKFLGQTRVPAPPLDVQRRIADLLDRVDILRTERRTSIDLADELAAALFHETFGADATQELAALGSVADFHSGTTLPTGIAFTGQPGGYLLLKVADLAADEIELTTARRWSPTPGTRAATCPAGCLVFPKRGGAIATNRKRMTARPAILDPNLMAIRPHGVAPAYLFDWFLGLDLETLTTGSSVPQLNKKDLAPLMIPIPPLLLQHAYTATAERHRDRIRTLRAQITEFDTLYAALSHRTFG